MKKQKCEICNSELYVAQYDTVFCPKCEGITPFTKKSSLNICKQLIEDTEEWINL